MKTEYIELKYRGESVITKRVGAGTGLWYTVYPGFPPIERLDSQHINSIVQETYFAMYCKPTLKIVLV